MDIRKLYQKIQKNWDRPIGDLIDGNLNNKDDYGDTLLHYAAKSNDVCIVKKLLQAGVIYDQRNNEGKKPIDVADSSEIADLLKSCESFFKKITDGNLHEISKYISEFKIFINVKEKDFFSPLFMAVSDCNEAVVRLLLKNGADAFHVTDKGFTSLHVAVSKEDLKITQLLLQYVERDELFRFVNAQTYEDQTTCLHIATENECFEILKLLLKNGAIYNIKNKLNQMPIHLCKAKNEKVEIFFKLTDYLFECAKSGKPRLINELNQLGISEFEALTNAKNFNHHTLLQVLTIYNHKFTAEKLTSLLQRKNKKAIRRQWTLMELRDLQSSTCAIFGAVQVNIIILKVDYCTWGYDLDTLGTGLYCLTRICDFLSICKEYSSCLNIDNYLLKIKTTLEELQFDPDEASSFYENRQVNDNVITQHEKYFYELLSSSSDKEKSKQKVSLFVIIVERDILKPMQDVINNIEKQKIPFQSSCELMKFIEESSISEVLKHLKKGANVNFLNAAGESPLQRAIKYGFTEIVDILLENKADINFVTPQGNTYLHLVATLNVSFFSDRDIPLSVTVKLLKYGAVYNANNHEGKTPSNVSKHRKVTKLLKNIDLCFKYAEEDNMDVLSILGDMNENELNAVTCTSNDKGYTLLQTAAFNADKKLEKKILCMLKKRQKEKPQSDE